MKGEDIFRALTEMDAALVEEAAAAPVIRPRRWVKWAAAVAACLCLAVGVGSAVAEAQAYQTAVEFFEENGLSAEGLSRAEVKEVYRDIRTRSFSNVNTAAVLNNSLVPLQGFELSQTDPAPEALKALWEQWEARRSSGVHYRHESIYVMDEEKGYEVHDHDVFEKYDGAALLWQVQFPEFWIEDYITLADGVLLWGQTPVTTSRELCYTWLARIRDDGELLWKKHLAHGYDYEYIAAVVPNGDGSFAVFSRGDLEDLVLSQWSADGAEQSFRGTNVGNVGIWHAARLGEDYIVHLGNITENSSILWKVSHDGELSNAFNYSAGDCDYFFSDMAEFGGKLYLSGCAVPKREGEDSSGGRFEIDGVLREIFAREDWNIDSDELVELLRKNFTAVLLVCDPDSQTPETFYSIPGARGLTLEAGETLQWSAAGFSEAVFSPITSAWSIRAQGQVYRYTFGADGSLLGQEATEEVEVYYR